MNKKYCKEKILTDKNKQNRSSGSTNTIASIKIKRQKQEDHVSLQQKITEHTNTHTKEVKNNDINLNVEGVSEKGSISECV